MPRYYCDYCDTYLTHDSCFLFLQPSVRKQHNQGYKHKANVRNYFQQFEEQQTQSLIDQKVREHLGQTGGFQQVGAAFNQHLASLQYRPPVLHPPTLPIPGSVPQAMPTFRPPVFPAPTPASGYTQSPGVMPTFRPPVAPIPLSASQANGLSTVSNMSATTNVPYHGGPVGSSASTPAAYQQHTLSLPPSSSSVGSFSSSTPAESESGSSQDISRVPGSYASFNSHLSPPVSFTAPSAQGSYSYGQANGNLTHPVQMLNTSASQPPGAPVG
ncbi:hypothetical protein O6H91_07G061100 [Diphasiastrum complanatum]|uniref:Uncharacterized protein n=1 Tax=Diphasiastrum complanatum TaxID=34168 RepID=A0ACC2D5T2_DIPCM|nr:hypothetical protein O6H91_07G061100 [Diphasiastrum complanatum]